MKLKSFSKRHNSNKLWYKILFQSPLINEGHVAGTSMSFRQVAVNLKPWRIFWFFLNFENILRELVELMASRESRFCVGLFLGWKNFQCQPSFQKRRQESTVIFPNDSSILNHICDISISRSWCVVKVKASSYFFGTIVDALILERCREVIWKRPIQKRPPDLGLCIQL